MTAKTTCLSEISRGCTECRKLRGYTYVFVLVNATKHILIIFIGIVQKSNSRQNTIIDKSAVNNRIFAHENHPWPLSLASNGIMHQMNMQI